MSSRAMARLRRLCLALPHAYEKEAWGSATFRVEKGKIFAMAASNTQPNGKGRLQVWLNADKVNQELLISMRPARYFSPPYVGPSGWVGAWLDGVEDWDELRELLDDAWRRAAPKSVLKAVDAGASPAKAKTEATPAAKAKRPAAPKATSRAKPKPKSKPTAKATPARPARRRA
jgi:hypothetical protein